MTCRLIVGDALMTRAISTIQTNAEQSVLAHDQMVTFKGLK